MTARIPAALYRLRAMETADHAFAFKSWLTSYIGSPLTRMLTDEKWRAYAGHHRIVTRIIERSAGIVAHVPDDPSVILGWLVYEPETLHYVFVKGAARGFGLSRAMIERALGDTCAERCITFTHKSPDLLRLTRREFLPAVDGGDAEPIPPKLQIPEAWRHCFYAVDGPVSRFRDRRNEGDAAP